jgi:uncharacterized DUF497 family protein
VNFEWDPDKDAWNYVKHGIRFETATMVFDDPYHVSQLDRVVDGEERWRTMGLIGGLVIVIVAHTYREQNGEETVRIISARKATKRERKHYEERNY